MAKRKKIEQQVQEESHLVFVYGTLKRGGSNHRYLQIDGAEFIEEATIPGGIYKMLNINNMYPALVKCEKGTCPEIHGEIYKITPKVLSILDILEGRNKVDNLFDLEIFVYANGKKVYIYLAGPRLLRHLTGNPRVVFPEILSGNWEIKKQ